MVKPEDVEGESSLESSLKSILNSDKSPSEKKQAYIDVLRQITIRDEHNRETDQLPIKNAPSKYDFSSVIENMGKNLLSKRAKTFLSYLNTLPNINWTPKGVVFLDGTRLDRSNIIDLVLDSVSNKTLQTSPMPWAIYRDWLRAQNIPTSFLGSNAKNVTPNSPPSSPSAYLGNPNPGPTASASASAPAPAVGAPAAAVPTAAALAALGTKRGKKVKRLAIPYKRNVTGVRVSSRANKGLQPARYRGDGFRWISY